MSSMTANDDDFKEATLGFCLLLDQIKDKQMHQTNWNNQSVPLHNI